MQCNDASISRGDHADGGAMQAAGALSLLTRDPILAYEKTVCRLFIGDRECTKLHHAARWLEDWRMQNPGRQDLPSAQRVCNGVRVKYYLRISKPIALVAIAEVRERSVGHAAGEGAA